VRTASAKPEVVFRQGMPKRSERGEWLSEADILERCVDMAVDCIHAMADGTAAIRRGEDGKLWSVSWLSTDGSGADDDVWFVDPPDDL